MLGRCCEEFLGHVDATGKRLCLDCSPLAACVRDGSAYEAQVFLRHKQGGRVPVAVRVQPIRAADGSIVGAVEIFSDETAHHVARREAEELERLAFLDQVTHLPNRRYLEMALRTALNEYHVHKDTFGLMVIDLDRFKTINDRFGHGTGIAPCGRWRIRWSALCGPTTLWDAGEAMNFLLSCVTLMRRF